jgi:hypothetical protein
MYILAYKLQRLRKAFPNRLWSHIYVYYYLFRSIATLSQTRILSKVICNFPIIRYVYPVLQITVFGIMHPQFLIYVRAEKTGSFALT